MSTNSLITFSRNGKRNKSYIPVIGADTTPPTLANPRVLIGRYIENNKLLSISFHYSFDAAAIGMALGAGDYTFSIPPGFNIDYTNLTTMAIIGTMITGSTLGMANVALRDHHGSGCVHAVPGNVMKVALSSLTLPFEAIKSVSSTWYGMDSGAYSLSFTAHIPII